MEYENIIKICENYKELIVGCLLKMIDGMIECWDELGGLMISMVVIELNESINVYQKISCKFDDMYKDTLRVRHQMEAVIASPRATIEAPSPVAPLHLYDVAPSLIHVSNS